MAPSGAVQRTNWRRLAEPWEWKGGLETRFRPAALSGGALPGRRGFLEKSPAEEEGRLARAGEAGASHACQDRAARQTRHRGAAIFLDGDGNLKSHRETEKGAPLARRPLIHGD